MRRHGGFGGSVVISAVATALLLIAITGARRPPHLEARGAPPWLAPAAAADGVHIAGLTMSAQPGVVTRYAVHLDVLVDGRAVAVPAGIGMDAHTRQLAPLYTEDGSGIVHISSDAAAPEFTLGQFFDEWQVPVTASRLGGLRNGVVAAYVNGTRFGGDPGSVVLKPHLEIAVSYGPNRAVPKGYAFPAGT